MPLSAFARNTYKNKQPFLEYFRQRAAESYGEITKQFGQMQYKDRAQAVNTAMQQSRDQVLATLIQTAKGEKWPDSDILPNVLMTYHCANVAMIEYRNTAWPYDYMTFSRRIGELWEPFCRLCFDYPVRTDVALYVPPLFADVRNALTTEIRDFIAKLDISPKQRAQLLVYYDKVWSLLASGEIKLELDLHFKIKAHHYDVDLKSGFSSNEKGNTNRLLLVASIYKNIIATPHTCMLFVRSTEDESNHYLQTLKASGLWEVYCGKDAYAQIKQYSGFNLRAWIDANITWKTDFSKECLKHLKDQDLVKYLKW